MNNMDNYFNQSIDNFLNQPVTKCYVCNRYVPIREGKIVLHTLPIKLSELEKFEDLPECAGTGLQITACPITYLESTQRPDRFG